MARALIDSERILEVLTSATGGVGEDGIAAPRVTKSFRNVQVQFAGDFGSGNVTLQGTIDETNWFEVQAAISAAAVVSVADAVRKLRVKTNTGVTAVTAVMGGLYDRAGG